MKQRIKSVKLEDKEEKNSQTDQNNEKRLKNNEEG